MRPDLSPAWRGVDVGLRPLNNLLPFWIGGAALLVLMLGLYIWLEKYLSRGDYKKT